MGGCHRVLAGAAGADHDRRVVEQRGRGGEPGFEGGGVNDRLESAAELAVRLRDAVELAAAPCSIEVTRYALCAVSTRRKPGSSSPVTLLPARSRTATRACEAGLKPGMARALHR